MNTPTGAQPLGGRHALVTGASRGIGAAIAAALEAAGATVSRLARHGGDGIIAADVTDPDAVARAVAAARDRHGPVHILVNNAGHAETAPFARSDAALLQRMLDVHLHGPWRCIQALLPDLEAAGSGSAGGRVINVASSAGQKGYAYASAYCAAKHALVGLTRSLALEFAAKGVTVNALCPGYTDTELLRRAATDVARRSGRGADDVLAAFAASNPQQRLVRPEEVAAAALWLCGPGSGAVTGQTLSLSCGEIMS